jgi:hypothetical protein
MAQTRARDANKHFELAWIVENNVFDGEFSRSK